MAPQGRIGARLRTARSHKRGSVLTSRGRVAFVRPTGAGEAGRWRPVPEQKTLRGRHGLVHALALLGGELGRARVYVLPAGLRVGTSVVRLVARCAHPVCSLTRGRKPTGEFAAGTGSIWRGKSGLLSPAAFSRRDRLHIVRVNRGDADGDEGPVPLARRDGHVERSSSRLDDHVALG